VGWEEREGIGRGKEEDWKRRRVGGKTEREKEE